MTAKNFLSVLAIAGLGWKDIRASNIEKRAPSCALQPQFTMSMNIYKR
jgi:hypothetical protein